MISHHASFRMISTSVCRSIIYEINYSKRLLLIAVVLSIASFFQNSPAYAEWQHSITSGDRPERQSRKYYQFKIIEPEERVTVDLQLTYDDLTVFFFHYGTFGDRCRTITKSLKLSDGTVFYKDVNSLPAKNLISSGNYTLSFDVENFSSEHKCSFALEYNDVNQPAAYASISSSEFINTDRLLDIYPDYFERGESVELSQDLMGFRKYLFKKGFGHEIDLSRVFLLNDRRSQSERHDALSRYCEHAEFFPYPDKPDTTFDKRQYVSRKPSKEQTREILFSFFEKNSIPTFSLFSELLLSSIISEDTANSWLLDNSDYYNFGNAVDVALARGCENYDSVQMNETQYAIFAYIPIEVSLTTSNDISDFMEMISDGDLINDISMLARSQISENNNVHPSNIIIMYEISVGRKCNLLFILDFERSAEISAFQGARLAGGDCQASYVSGRTLDLEQINAKLGYEVSLAAQNFNLTSAVKTILQNNFNVIDDNVSIAVSGDNFVSIYVSGLKGFVLGDSNYWEHVHIIAAITGEKPTIRIIVDVLYSPGVSRPPVTLSGYEYDAEIEFQNDIILFSENFIENLKSVAIDSLIDE